MKNLKVLLVEDDPIIGRDTKKILEFLGYSVFGPFAKAEDGLKESEKIAFNILVLDIELKGKMNGIELSEKINGSNPLPTVFITGLLDENTKSSAINAGASAFLNKPFNERNLVNAIEMALQKPIAKPEKAEKAEKNIGSFFVKVNKRYLRIDLDEIDFLEASGHYMVIHSGNTQYSTSSSMSSFLNKNKSETFFQTHRSYIVNMAKVKDFDDTHIYFGDKMVPISKSNQKEFKNKLSII
jgi:DNA-binding LytR/AlgR family response regulator